MSIQLLLDGDDFSNYVVSTERNHTLCRPIAQLTIQLSPNLPRDVNTYEDVVFYEDGTKVFTGYTQGVVHARMPVEVTLTCSDVLIKAKDTWLEEEYISGGESVAHWVGRFLSLSDLSDRSLSSSQQVYPGFGWQYTTAIEAITQTLQMTYTQIFANRNGRVILAPLLVGTPTATISEYIDYERTRNDSWIRNRAVVIGHAGNVADIRRSNPYLPGETRAAIVATGAIYNLSTATTIAEAMLDEFENPLDVKKLLLPGNPSYELGQTVRFTDSWSGYSENCLVISITSTYNSEEYTTEVILDEKCINFWGWDRPPPEYITMYCGTWGHGVYKSTSSAFNWSPTALTGVHVYDIDVVTDENVWAACREGVYHTLDGGESYITQTMGVPSGQRIGESYSAADLYWVGVVVKHVDTNDVFVLAGAFDNGGVWVYYTGDDGGCWFNVRIV